MQPDPSYGTSRDLYNIMNCDPEDSIVLSRTRGVRDSMEGSWDSLLSPRKESVKSARTSF